MSNELKNLKERYFHKCSGVWNNGFNCLSFDELSCVLLNLIEFESPDMYSIVSDKLVLLEHFEFDYSQNSKKGMKGKKEESELYKRISNDNSKNEWKFDRADYLVSLECWQNNFEATFDNHYKKIDTYINNVKMTQPKISETIFGFVIENKFSPMVNYKNRPIGELEYVRTKQFWNFFSQKKVDFILFVGYFNGKPQITYVDHKSSMNSDKLMDLQDKDLSISIKLHNNEITMYGSFDSKVGENNE